jgi:hypothetical protein
MSGFDWWNGLLVEDFLFYGGEKLTLLGVPNNILMLGNQSTIDGAKSFTFGVS